jgi:hypothetical protein
VIAAEAELTKNVLKKIATKLKSRHVRSFRRIFNKPAFNNNLSMRKRLLVRSGVLISLCVIIELNAVDPVGRNRELLQRDLRRSAKRASAVNFKVVPTAFRFLTRGQAGVMAAAPISSDCREPLLSAHRVFESKKADTE